MEVSGCETIEGQPDFYGLGIRIGVYLQWVSAWINLLIDPESAQSVYDVNSVFVFSILVATMIATLGSSPSIQPIETHIMLQFALGFFVTTLSTFGLRLHFFRPASIVELGGCLGASMKALRVSIRKPVSPIDWFYLVIGTPILPLNVFSPLKPRQLSWSGVVWRTSTMCIVAAVNIWLWWVSQPNYRLPGQACDPPFIFMFSKQQLSGPIVGFCKAVAIIIAIVVFPPFWILFQLVIQLHTQAVLALYRDIMHSVTPDAPQHLSRSLNRINSLLDRKGIALPVPSQLRSMSGGFDPMLGSSPTSQFINFNPLSQFRSFYDFVEFMAKPSHETFRLSDVLRLMVYLGSSKFERPERVSMQGEDEKRSPQREATYLEYYTSLFWNAFTIISIAWFILSIEFTLSWNNIQGVNSIDNTGQLIPFVIGCVSTVQVIKKVTLLLLAKRYDDWADMTLEVSMNFAGQPVISKIRNTRNTLENDDQGISTATEEYRSRS